MSQDKYNTLEAIELAQITIESLQASLEGAYAELREAQRVHRAAESVRDLSWDDALEDLSDEVGDYGFAASILRYDRDGGGTHTGEPEIAGVSVSHLTPDVVELIHEAVAWTPTHEQAVVVNRMIAAEDREAERDAIEVEQAERFGY